MTEHKEQINLDTLNCYETSAGELYTTTRGDIVKAVATHDTDCEGCYYYRTDGVLKDCVHPAGDEAPCLDEDGGLLIFVEEN